MTKTNQNQNNFEVKDGNKTKTKKCVVKDKIKQRDENYILQENCGINKQEMKEENVTQLNLQSDILDETRTLTNNQKQEMIKDDITINLASLQSELKSYMDDFKVINNYSSTNLLVYKGTIQSQKAILMINFVSPNELNLNELRIKPLLKNDIYHTFTSPFSVSTTCRLIYPATEKEWKKYSNNEYEYVKETKEDYDKKLKGLGDENWVKDLIENVNLALEKNENKDVNLNEKSETKNDNSYISKDNNVIKSVIVEVETKKIIVDCTVNEKIYSKNKTNQEKLYAKSIKLNTNDLSAANLVNQKIVTLTGNKLTVSKDGKQIFTETILFNDHEIIVIPNYSWDQEDISKIYLVVVFKQKGLYTIRELNDAEMLKRVKEKIYGVLENVYNVKSSDVYMFFHYHPTYFSLHLHVCAIKCFGIFARVGRAIMLDDVISCLELDRDYYKKKDMWIFKVKETENNI